MTEREHTVTPVVVRGDAFWARLREEHGDDVADDRPRMTLHPGVLDGPAG